MLKVLTSSSVREPSASLLEFSSSVLVSRSCPLGAVPNARLSIRTEFRSNASSQLPILPEELALEVVSHA